MTKSTRTISKVTLDREFHKYLKRLAIDKDKDMINLKPSDIEPFERKDPFIRKRCAPQKPRKKEVRFRF